MVDVSTVSIVVASAGVLVAATYYVLQIRHQTRIRQTDLVIRLYSAFISPEFLDASMKVLALEFKDYKDFVNKYGPIFSEKPELKALLIVDNFFNQVGILLHKGFIDAGLVREVFTYRVELLWKKVEPIIQGSRKELNQPEAGKWFEYLYNELQKKEQRSAKNV